MDDITTHACGHPYSTYGEGGRTEDSDDPCPECRSKIQEAWYMWNGEHGAEVRAKGLNAEEGMRLAFQAGWVKRGGTA